MPARVLTRAQLLTECCGERAMRTALATGRWVRVLHGVYAEPGDADQLAVRARAAALVLPPGTVVAGRSVLWLYGIDLLPPGPVLLDVLVDRGCVVPRRSGVRARQGRLVASDVGRVGTLPALRPARAAVDLMRQSRLEHSVAVADAVQHDGRCDAAGLAAELVRHVGLRGVVQARRALQLSTPLAESPPESYLRVALALAGLVAQPQYSVYDSAGRWLARVDLAFPDQRVALEYDGRAAHQGELAFVRDRRRQNELVAAGWTVLRFTAEDLRHRRAEVVDAVRQALARAA